MPHCALGNNKAPAWKERQQQRMGLGAACDSSRMRRDVSTSKWDKSGWKSAKIQRSGCFLLTIPWLIDYTYLSYKRRMAAFLKPPFLLSVLHCALSNQTIGPYGCNQDNQPPTRYSLNIYWPKVNKMYYLFLRLPLLLNHLPWRICFSIPLCLAIYVLWSLKN